MGIDNIKSVVSFLADFINQVKGTKKVNIFTILSFISDVKQVKAILDKWPTIIAEFKDLDANERTELFKFIIDEFNIPESQATEFIEEVATYLSTIPSLVSSTNPVISITTTTSNVTKTS